MHDADVRLEFWSSEPPRDGSPLGQVVVTFPSGSVTGWAIAHGPVGEALPLDGPGDYQLRVYKAVASPEGSPEEPPRFTGLESYLVQIWRCSTAE
jgi:hypothetical protein